MRNWRTTVGGILVAIGQSVQATSPKLAWLGQILTGVGALLLGINTVDRQNVDDSGRGR